MNAENLLSFEDIPTLEREQIQRNAAVIPVQAGSLNVSKVAKKYHILAVAQGCVRVYLLADTRVVLRVHTGNFQRGSSTV